MAIRIGINGFGRIGRMFYRAALDKKDLEVVAVNDITDAPTLAHLLKYDSIHGTLHHQVKAEGDQIMVDGHAFHVVAERDPAKLPWKELGVQVVVESTGLFTARDKAALHLSAGREEGRDQRAGRRRRRHAVHGRQPAGLRSVQKHDVISNASCTTNCLAPIAKVLHENFGIVARPDDHGAQLHLRPDAAGRPA